MSTIKMQKRYRKVFYTRMLLTFLRLKEEEDGRVGFCHVLERVLAKYPNAEVNRIHSSNTYISLKILPELWARKPKRTYKYSRWWWDPENKRKRIQILEEIIASMK